MRIVAGAWRGRTLVAPPGQGTRPTADRVRQALFDMLMHADWGGRSVFERATVLDVFAGTGALGLEALSRGAASACFVENDQAALRALRANIAACKAGDRTVILAVDALAVASASGPVQHGFATRAPVELGNRSAMAQGEGGASLVFLDPPYGQDLVPRALDRLHKAGRIGPDALVVAETGRDETWLPEQAVLAERRHGAARIVVFRFGVGASDRTEP
jgi:16S rRNA (guanine966-N2)-methyltransferase